MRVELAYMQNNIWCFANILRMASLNTLFSCSNKIVFIKSVFLIDDKKTVTWIKDIQISINVLLEWTIPEKKLKQGVEDMEFPGVLKK